MATKTCRGCGQPKERDGYQLCSPCAEARYDELHSGRDANSLRSVETPDDSGSYEGQS